MPKPTPVHHHRRPHIPAGADNFLSVLEGIEGGFAIFTGVIVGLSFSVQNRWLLITTGIITILVNAFNSSAIRYSTQHYNDELDGREKHNIGRYYAMPALTEFIAYAVVSFVVLLPLLFISPLQLAIALTVVLTIVVLFAAGWYRGKVLHTHPLRDALELSLLGGAIVLVGGIAGYALSH